MLLACKDPSDCKGVPALEDVWKFVTMTFGEQCVMTSGTIMMLEWPAGSLDLLAQVMDVLKYSIQKYDNLPVEINH